MEESNTNIQINKTFQNQKTDVFAAYAAFEKNEEKLGSFTADPLIKIKRGGSAAILTNSYRDAIENDSGRNSDINHSSGNLYKA